MTFRFNLDVVDDPRYLFKCGGNRNCYHRNYGISWQFINQNLYGKNTIGDIDGMIEKGGDILFLEFKTTTEIPPGQLYTLKHLSKKEGCHVCYVFGHIDWSEQHQCQVPRVWGIKPVVNGELKDLIHCSNEDLIRWVRKWVDSRSCKPI